MEKEESIEIVPVLHAHTHKHTIFKNPARTHTLYILTRRRCSLKKAHTHTHTPHTRTHTISKTSPREISAQTHTHTHCTHTHTHTLYILIRRRCSLRKSRYARKHAGLACPIEEMIEREGGLHTHTHTHTHTPTHTTCKEIQPRDNGSSHLMLDRRRMCRRVKCAFEQ
jgi:hypothetical protein